jgi:hypothetical protein
MFLVVLGNVMAFVPQDMRRQRFTLERYSAESSTLVVGLDDEVKRQLAKARALLQRADEKLESEPAPATNNQAIANKQDNNSVEETKIDPPTVPFFFASVKGPEKRDQVIKSVNENGLITTDGEKMASLSEQESWEIRRLDDVFENVAAVSSMAGRTLSEKDAAANIFSLRRQLQDSDFLRIFDKRNRFIGDLD